MSEENKTMYYFTEESLQSLVDETMAYADTKNVFVATYGATTYQEVVNAMNSGRVVQARDENGILYNFAVNVDEGIVFTQTDGQSVLIVMLMPQNEWVADSRSLVMLESLQAHIDDKSNPHKVTLKQLGVTASASVLNNLDGRVNDVANQVSDMLSMAEQFALSLQLSRDSALGWNGNIGDKHYIELGVKDGIQSGVVHVTDEVPDTLNYVGMLGGFVALDGIFALQSFQNGAPVLQLEFLSEEDVVIGYATDYTTDGDELIPLVIIATQDVNFDGILLNKGVYFYTSNMTLGDTSLPYIYVSSLYLPGETFDDPDITALQKELDKKAPSSHGYHVPTPETADTATFLRNDNTWQKITPDTIGAASSNHGLHVPAKQTADNAKFLRNDNTWQTVTPANIGAAPASHGYHVPTPETADNAKFLRNDNTWQKITPTNIGAVSSAELKQHADSNTHLTSDERTKWNTASAFATSHGTNHAPNDAEPNQNAFSTVTAGTANITASSETDSFSIVAGEGVSVTGDATNKKVTISNTGVKSVVEGTQNGTISVDGSPVSVHGLGSAAYTSSNSYDASGKADEAYAAAKNYTDGKIALLLDNSSEAVDSILELATAMQENDKIVDALSEAVGKKSSKSHTHSVSHTPSGTIVSKSLTPAGTVNSTFAGSAAEHDHTFTGTAGTTSGKFTPSGTVTSTFAGTGAKHKHTFTGTAGTASATYTPAGTVASTFTGASATHNHSFSGTAGTATASYTPAGTVASTFTGTQATLSVEYTPAGTVASTFNGKAVNTGDPSGTTSVYSITGVGTLPSLTGSVSNHCLKITWGAGSLPTRSSVTLPSTSHKHSVTAAGDIESIFTGTKATLSHTYTPAGTVSSAFTGTKATISSSYTPSGTIGNKSLTPAGEITSTFTGTQSTISSSFTPSGTISETTVTPSGTIESLFSGAEGTVSTSYTPSGTISKKSITPSGSVTSEFIGTAASHTHTFNGTAATLSTGAPIEPTT